MLGKDIIIIIHRGMLHHVFCLLSVYLEKLRIM